MNMETQVQHVTALTLESGLDDVLASPSDNGRLESIVVRPRTNERETVNVAVLNPETGIDGDKWVEDSFYRLKGGKSDPRCQVSIMNARFLRQIAGKEDAMCLAGDNLIVDFDLSEANAPTGTQLSIGREVVIEISDVKHTGCSKFARRYGQEARAFANNKRGTALHLRGRYASIVRGGTIRVGDTVKKLSGKETD
jgi:MOSC domain-containing protein YiiM